MLTTAMRACYNVYRGLLTSVELPHHCELKVLAVVPRVVQGKHAGSGLGLQLEGGQDESLAHPLLHQTPLQQVWQAIRRGEQIIDCRQGMGKGEKR